MAGDTHLVEWASIVLGLLCTALAVLSGIVTYRKRNMVTRNACKARRVRDGLFLKDVVSRATQSYQNMTEAFIAALAPNADDEDIRKRFNAEKDALVTNVAVLQGYADIISEEGICADGVSKLITAGGGQSWPERT